MRIGEANKRIDLQYPSSVADGMGGETITWLTSAANVAAKKTTIRSSEAILSMAATGTAIHKFEIRYREVGTTWRIKEGTKYFSIIGPPIADSKNRWLTIMAKEDS